MKVVEQHPTMNELVQLLNSRIYNNLVLGNQLYIL
jgi:hypothetical protein